MTYLTHVWRCSGERAPRTSRGKPRPARARPMRGVTPRRLGLTSLYIAIHTYRYVLYFRSLGELLLSCSCLARTESIACTEQNYWSRSCWKANRCTWTGEGMRRTRGGMEASGQRSSSTVSRCCRYYYCPYSVVSSTSAGALARWTIFLC